MNLDELGKYVRQDLTNNEKAILIVSAVNSWVESYTGRVFGNEKTFTETLDYEPVIFLSHVDITGIQSLKINGIEMANYRWNKEGRIVLSASGRYVTGYRARYDSVQVTYTSKASEAMPEDMKLALLQLAADNLNSEGSQGVVSASVGGYSLSFGTSGGSGSSSSSGGSQGGSSYMAILNHYRLRRV